MNRRDALKKSALALGAAAGAPTLISLLQACAKTDRLTWTPQFLSEDQARFISSFVDFLLPKTETPGGLDVKADVFIDLMYAKTYDEAGQNQVVADIEKFNADRNSAAADEAVKQDAADGTEVGVRGTPFFLINGVPLSGAQPVAAFEAVIQQHLANME